MTYYKTYKKSDFNSSKFIQILYKCRTTLNLSQSQFAKKLNCSTTAYNRYELGNFQRVSLKFIDSLSKFTGKKIEDIIEITNTSNNNAEDTNLNIWLASDQSKPYIKEAYKKYLEDEKQKQQKKIDKVFSDLSK